MKIAIVQAPMWGVDVPSLGLASLSSWLRKHGFKVKVFDFNIELFNSHISHKKYYTHDYNDNWDKEEGFKKLEIINDDLINKWVESIIYKKPEMVCFPIFLTTRQMSLKLAKEIKKKIPKTLIVFGGPDCVRGRNFESIVASGIVDAIVFGEGELTILELAINLKNKNMKKCKGCVLITKDKIIEGEPRELIKDLDVLPIPDYFDFDLGKYTEKNNFAIMMSRGCPMRCVYCSEGEYWKISRTRSGQSVYNEMRKLHMNYNGNYFHFGDCMINTNLNEVLKLCELLIKNNLKINWKVKAYPDNRFTFEFMKKMRNAGCVSWELGIESGSNRVIKEMGRHYNIETVKRILKYGKKAGIYINTFWMLGFPTETEEDFKKTLKLLTEIRNYIKIDPSSVSTFQVLHDTPFYNQMDRFNVKIEPTTMRWYTANHDNDSKVRKERYNRFNNLAKELDLLNKEVYIDA